MALIYCPECGHEVSNSAVACPNCGRPLRTPPVIERKAVVTEVDRGGFPTWAFIPLGILGALLLVLLFVFLGRDDNANANLRVNVNSNPPVTETRRTTRSESETAVSEPPVSSYPPSTTRDMEVPGTQVDTSNIPPPQPTTGSVVINAKIATKKGEPAPVKKERFYLLDEDAASILNDAGIEPLDGQTLIGTFGLSVVYPDRYGDFNRKALAALKDHIKYAGTTDSDGKAELGGIAPGSYYLFGVTKAGTSFALWNSPVVIMAGQNNLNLSPQPLTETRFSPSE